jgi:uncharacterized protein YqgC (DUF456 family)
MDLQFLIVTVIAVAIMLIGLLGAILPGLPSTPLVVVGAMAHRALLGPNGSDWWVIIALLIITIGSLILEYLASIIGAKKLGATWRGITGAVVGTIVGFFFSLPGLILGPFIGAFTFEIVGGRSFEESGKAGIGAILGLLAGALGKIIACVLMIGLFVSHVIFKAF